MANPYGSNRQLYQPTSLDFINRPNPVEPQSVPQRHPLNGTPQIQNGTSTLDSLPLFLQDHAGGPSERPAKRRKPGDRKSRDLPQLPIRPAVKRQRLPPTLSGLHQPPPDAGLLPSISFDQPAIVGGNPFAAQAEPAVLLTPTSATLLAKGGTENISKPPDSVLVAPVRRRKWSDEETAFLLKGVAKFGIGNWTKILKCEAYTFHHRNALDLKDRFRVCCPDNYKRSKRISRAKTNVPGVSLPPRIGKSRSDIARMTPIELRDLGIGQPFAQSKRRKRLDYTAAEDEALLRGFELHGNLWSNIKENYNLELARRTPRDLRDRFRTRYPDKYKEAGMAPRRSPKPPVRGKENRDSTDVSAEDPPIDTAILDDAVVRAFSSTGVDPNILISSSSNVNKNHQSNFLPYDDVDVFFGFGDDEADAEHIVLDRTILEWAGAPSSGVDPRASLDPPRLHAAPSQSHLFGPGETLPSVAAITSETLEDPGSQLELPSLVFGAAFENETRSGGHALT